MRGKCNICGRIGDWPVFPCEVWYPNQNVPQQEQELLCAGCYEQTGAPFPDDVPEDELRKWHEECHQHIPRTPAGDEPEAKGLRGEWQTLQRRRGL
jgi:hypothetical protein